MVQLILTEQNQLNDKIKFILYKILLFNLRSCINASQHGFLSVVLQ